MPEPGRGRVASPACDNRFTQAVTGTFNGYIKFVVPDCGTATDSIAACGEFNPDGVPVDGTTTAFFAAVFPASTRTTWAFLPTSSTTTPATGSIGGIEGRPSSDIDGTGNIRRLRLERLATGRGA